MSRLQDVVTYFHHFCPAPHTLYIVLAGGYSQTMSCSLFPHFSSTMSHMCFHILPVQCPIHLTMWCMIISTFNSTMSDNVLQTISTLYQYSDLFIGQCTVNISQYNVRQCPANCFHTLPVQCPIYWTMCCMTISTFNSTMSDNVLSTFHSTMSDNVLQTVSTLYQYNVLFIGPCAV